MQFIDALYDFSVFFLFWACDAFLAPAVDSRAADGAGGIFLRPRFIINALTGNSQKLRLALHSQFRRAALPINHFFALRSPILPSALDKKSFSMVSWPILASMALMSGPGSFFPFLNASSA